MYLWVANGKKAAKDEIAVYVNGELFTTSPLRPGEDLTVAFNPEYPSLSAAVSSR